MSVFPYFPVLRNLRLAVPADVMRLGVISSAGFRYSPVFDWERPYHTQYPQDTLDSYRSMYISAMKDPRIVMVVATDKYDPAEVEKTKAIIPPEVEVELPKAGEDVVVGVAYWKFEPGLKRVGQFKNEEGPYPTIPKNAHRDEDPVRCAAAEKVWMAADEKYLWEYASMNIVVVHPAYWRRGHGSALVKWGMAMTDMDKTTQGVISADIGTKLYDTLGFEKLCEAHVDGDERTPEGLVNGIMRYGAATKKSSL
ncbi:hypothetical protein BKA65DRAFT_295055 [Rhexocercosporidium sp. MPI-PUGE-AT-0058]|nr:hypothetical protein BKA65DRAFT_295055 [Rhexocercosporidium sp. MPI-PUGE-AT-0058]